MPEAIPFTLVDSDEQLRECCARLQSAAVIALDTEFVRTNTYHAKLGLVQLADRDHCWLVDPLAIDDLEPLRQLLTAPTVLKVLHSCSEDLQVLQSGLGVLPQPLFDTQVAAGFVNEPFSMGYARLIKALLDIELDKHETRSDWLQRPLSESQLYYAAEDVHYLIRAYAVLAERLDAVGRRAWVEEDMQTLLEAAQPEDPARAYLRIKAAWQLDRPGLAALQTLAEWREREVRERDMPRNWLIADRELMALAETRPRSLPALAAAAEIAPKTLRRQGETLLDLLAQSQANPDHWPEPLPDRLPREASRVLKALRKVVEETAESIGIAPELLARKKELEALARAVWQREEPQLQGALASGWRREVIGEPLLACAREVSL